MSLLALQVIVDGENRTKLIVNYLPQALTEAELHSIFSRCGEVSQHFFKLLFTAGGCPWFEPGEPRGFVITVRDTVPFPTGGACCFGWVSRQGTYCDGTAVGNTTNILNRSTLCSQSNGWCIMLCYGIGGINKKRFRELQSKWGKYKVNRGEVDCAEILTTKELI